MRVVRQILVGLGLIIIGVGAIVTLQGIVTWTTPSSARSVLIGAIVITVLGAALVIAGLVLTVIGIRKRTGIVPEIAADVVADAGADG
jgi:hypothetical protein